MVQDMTAEELEEMMNQAGQSESGEGKELQVSMEQKEGSSPGGDEQQCVSLFVHVALIADTSS